MTVSPPTTPGQVLFDICASLLLGGAFAITKFWRDDVEARRAKERDEWLRRQLDAIRHSQVSAAHAPTPRVRLDFSWEVGEQEAKPVIVRNDGKGEARHVKISPITFGQCTVTFPEIPLLGGGDSVPELPEFECVDSGLFWTPQNLIDFIKSGVEFESVRASQRRKATNRPSNWMEDLEFVFRVGEELRSRKLEVVVLYEDDRSRKFSTVYALEFEMFADVSRAVLNWVEDR